MRASRTEVYAAIDGEREYQKKWENPAVTDSGGLHSNVEDKVNEYVNSGAWEEVQEAIRTAKERLAEMAGEFE